MNNNSSIVDELLYEEESTTLDFKEKEYNFEYADDGEKSELLKDILAFANAWRRTDAYIMIGIEEVKGGKSRVIGISKHIDDADLQQFVNSKTQRPVVFSYQVTEYDSKQIGLIHIPLQERPIYLKKDYGRLKKHTVYIRRGSSTVVAEPDEVTRMGVSSGTIDKRSPVLNIQFANTEKSTLLGSNLDISTIALDVPDDSAIPGYGLSTGPFTINLGMENTNFYRELAEYMKIRASVKSLNFAVTNSGGMVAHNVRVEAEIKDISENIFLMSEDDIPNQPVKSKLNMIANIRGINVSSDIHVKKNPKSWLVTIDLDKIQPKRTVYTESTLFVSTAISSTLELKCNIYADNLSDPIIKSLKIKVNPEHRILTVKQLVKQGDSIE